MSINVLFFASLREQLGLAQLETDWQTGMTTGDIWQQTTAQNSLPDNVLVACNQQYCDWQTVVAEGDEVAFFPPVTGG